MQKKMRLISFILLSIVVNQAFAQFEISKYTINSGGGKSSGSTYQLTASMGQIDASQKLSQAGFSVVGGFWSAELVSADEVIFMNGFED